MDDMSEENRQRWAVLGLDEARWQAWVQEPRRSRMRDSRTRNHCADVRQMPEGAQAQGAQRVPEAPCVPGEWVFFTGGDVSFPFPPGATMTAAVD